jgi:carboxymethylenebutenolidase
VCYDADATPPVYGPAVTAVTTAAPLTLASADGTRFAAFLARPEQSSGASVVVFPDNRGLSHFYEKLAIRLAEQGHTALGIDYFGRTAGTGYRDRDESFAAMENLMPHLRKLTSAGLEGDIAAAAAHLRPASGPNGSRVIALGFCFGGRQAYRAAAARFGFAGTIGFYGYPDVLFGTPGPTQLAAELSAPILALWGGGDAGIPSAVVATFDNALTVAGYEHEFVTYPGAPHGFFELGAREFADASADAWRRVLEFLARHGSPATS